jgi:hypothetical protein
MRRPSEVFGGELERGQELDQGDVVERMRRQGMIVLGQRSIILRTAGCR